MAEMKAASTRGKKFNQKIKPYVVLQYLLIYTDEDNIVTAPEIVDFLEEHGMEAERRLQISARAEKNQAFGHHRGRRPHGSADPHGGAVSRSSGGPHGVTCHPA